MRAPGFKAERLHVLCTSICLRILLFLFVGFKGSPSLLETFLFFPGGLSKWKSRGADPKGRRFRVKQQVLRGRGVSSRTLVRHQPRVTCFALIDLTPRCRIPRILQCKSPTWKSTRKLKTERTKQKKGNCPICHSRNQGRSDLKQRILGAQAGNHFWNTSKPLMTID